MYSFLPLKRFLPILLSVILLVSCAHNRIVPIYTDQDRPYYAVTVNGVIVPEYTIDFQGKYAVDKNEAKELFLERRRLLRKQINKKYRIPHTVSYQMKHIPLSTGLFLVSPIVVPILFASDLFRQKDTEKTKINLKKTFFDYLEIALNEPINYEVALQNEFEIVNIQP
jgi:hypothetical protein